MKDLKWQRCKQEADKCDNQGDGDVIISEDAGASHQFRVSAAVPDSGQRQQTGEQDRQTDDMMHSRTGTALWRVNCRQQNVLVG